MKNYKHNYKKNRYRGNGDKSFKRNGSNHTFEENFSVITEFRRNKPSRDKILSENYFQHADHFIRISDQKNTEKEYKKSQENSKVSTSPENETENLNTETS